MILKTHMMSAYPPLLRRPVLEQELDALPASASPSLYSLLKFWSDAADTSDVPSRDRLDVFTLRPWLGHIRDRKSTRLNSSHLVISYAVFCLKKKKTKTTRNRTN